MKTVKKYCKYCGKPYWRQVSGDGCHNELNNEQFCPECMEIMLAALKQAGIIKHNYHSKYKKLTEQEINDFGIIGIIEQLDKEYEKENLNLPRAIRCLPISGYEKIQGYVYMGKEIIKCFSEDETVDYLMLYEYDKTDKEYKDIYKRDSINSYRFDCSGQKMWKNEDVPVRKIEPPSGRLFFYNELCNNYPIKDTYNLFSTNSTKDLLNGIIKK